MPRTPVKPGTWTRIGHSLYFNGKPALYLQREVDANGNGQLSPTLCDAISDLLHKVLETTDLDALHREWMEK